LFTKNGQGKIEGKNMVFSHKGVEKKKEKNNKGLVTKRLVELKSKKKLVKVL